MCGRYTSTSSIDELVDQFDVAEVRTPELPARWNVAPTQEVYVIVAGRGAPTPAPSGEGAGGEDGVRSRRLGALRWGLVPPWADDPSSGPSFINARAETVMSKPAFREAFARRRCLIPADAFYEWRRSEPSETPTGPPSQTSERSPPPQPTRPVRLSGSRQPYAIRRKDRRAMAFAGLWTTWRGRRGAEPSTLRSCAIVTTAANSAIAIVHHRMPVVLGPDEADAWLDPALDLGEARALLSPAGSELFEVFLVGPAVNRVANEGPDLIREATAPN
jgi:putative SOS response-associated peptidase YedK